MEPAGKIREFRDLDVWRMGKSIALRIYRDTERFPRAELFGMVSQMRRSAASIPSNIAEGFSRTGSRDYRRFLSIALGSCSELETQVELSSDLGFLSRTASAELIDDLNHEARMLQNLSRKVLIASSTKTTNDDRRPTTSAFTDDA
jgi:four helix bundle protein